MTSTKNYRPAGLPSQNQPDGDRRFLKQELDKLQNALNGINQNIAGINTDLTSPANTIKGNNTGATSPTLDLSVAQVQALLGIGQGRVPLLTNTTFYIDSSGNDSTGFGTSTSPWATWQFAYKTIANTYDFRGHTVTISSLTTTSYSAGAVLSTPWLGGGGLILDGNGSTISAGTCFATQGPPLAGSLTVQNFILVPNGGVALLSGAPGTINVGAGITFSTANANSIHMLTQAPAASIVITSNYTIAPGTGTIFAHCYSQIAGSNISNIGTLTATFTGNLTVTYFILGTFPSSIVLASMTYTLGGFTVTGVRYFGTYSCAIVTNSGASATYFPGTIAGVLQNNATYT